jgi:tetratricopeptide (TPR) repeat protein
MLEQAVLAKEIIKNWEIGAKLDSTHHGIKWGLLNFYSQAPSFMGGGMDKAYKVADQLNKLKYPDGFEAKGYVFERDNKKELAEKSFNEAIKASPKEVKYYYALAYFELRQNKTDKSIELFEKIIEINPKEAYANLEIGIIYSANIKMLDQGKQYLNRFLEIADQKNKNDLCRANYYLGNIHNSKGDKPVAKKYYEIALTLNPKFKDAQKALEKL